MQTKPKSNSVVTTAWDPASRVQTFTVLGVAEKLELRYDNLSQAVRDRGLIGGMNQRCVNAAALSHDTATGKAATPEAKHAAIKVLVDHYNSGAEAWGPTRAVKVGPGLDTVVLAAVAEATGKTDAEVRTMVAEGSARKSLTPKDYLAALATAAKVKPILERMRLGGVTEDGDALLAEATGEEGGEGSAGQE